MTYIKNCQLSNGKVVFLAIKTAAKEKYWKLTKSAVTTPKHLKNSTTNPVVTLIKTTRTNNTANATSIQLMLLINWVIMEYSRNPLEYNAF